MASDVMEQEFFSIPNSAILLSLVLHISLPILLVSFHLLDKWGLFPNFHKAESTKQVYQNFIQVDVVALPDALPTDKQSLDMTLPVMPKAGGGPVPITPPPPATDSMKHKQALAEEAAQKIHKEKARKAEEDKILKHLQEEAAREAALNSIAGKGKQKGRQQISGNILSKGASTTGMIGTSKDQYGALVSQAIHEHFNPYLWLQRRKLVSVVHIELYATTGRLRQKKIVKSSGDSTYDSAVLQAIDEAQPLPIPADSSIIADGITIEFRPEKP